MSTETIRHTAPESPCTGVCTIGSTGQCQGCRRTLAEIAAWGTMTAREQWRLVEALAERDPLDGTHIG